MSKSAQRKKSVIGLGRRAGHRNLPKCYCPFVHPRYRSWWLEGWADGQTKRLKQLKLQQAKVPKKRGPLGRFFHRALSFLGI